MSYLHYVGLHGSLQLLGVHAQVHTPLTPQLYRLCHLGSLYKALVIRYGVDVYVMLGLWGGIMIESPCAKGIPNALVYDSYVAIYIWITLIKPREIWV